MSSPLIAPLGVGDTPDGDFGKYGYQERWSHLRGIEHSYALDFSFSLIRWASAWGSPHALFRSITLQNTLSLRPTKASFAL